MCYSCGLKAGSVVVEETTDGIMYKLSFFWLHIQSLYIRHAEMDRNEYSSTNVG